MSDTPDLGDVLRQAMELQQQLLAAREEAASQTVTGSAGGGLVRIAMLGGGEVTDVRIDPGAVAADEIDVLEDLVLAAFRDAQEQVRQLQAAAMGGLPALPGLGALGLGPPDEGG